MSSGLLAIVGIRFCPQSSSAPNDLLDRGSLVAALPAAPAPTGVGGGMFGGMSMSGSGGVESAYASQTALGVQPNAMGLQQGMVPYGQSISTGMMAAQQLQPNNPGMFQMTPYGLQQQDPLRSGGYDQTNVGLAGPGQVLQIQAAPAYTGQYAQPQQQSGDKFSAFDGL